MLTYDATALAALASDARDACFLIELDFTTGTQYWTNWAVDIAATTTTGAHTFTGKGSLIGITNLSNSEDVANEKLKFTLPIINQAMLAAAVGDASAYRNKAMRVYIQVKNGVGVNQGAPVLVYDGVMDKHSVEYDEAPKNGGARTGRICLYCAKRGLSFVRRNTGLRLSHAQQLVRFPGDNGLEYLQSLLEKPAPWMSKALQEALAG